MSKRQHAYPNRPRHERGLTGRISELLAQLYWHEHHSKLLADPEWQPEPEYRPNPALPSNHPSQWVRPSKKSVLFGLLPPRRVRKITARWRHLATLIGTLPDETDEHGNTILRDGAAEEYLAKAAGQPARKGEERYRYDFTICTRALGWQQWDTHQDAWYFGIWVHPQRREIFTYAEGDRTLLRCRDHASFAEAIAGMEKFYGSPGPAMIGFGAEGRTDFYSDRLSVTELSGPAAA